MKHIISVLVTLCLVVGLVCTGAVSVGAATVPAGYAPIYTPQDLDNIRNDLAGKYILMNDIDMSGWGNWVLIGANERQTEDGDDWDVFTGVFDGNSHKIRNLTCAGGNAAALFVGIAGKGIVKNLYLIDVTITATNYASGLAMVAMGEATILNCSISGSITAEHGAGGIVARAIYGYSTRPTIRGCHNAATVTARTAGGIVGSVHRSEGYDVLGGYEIGVAISRCFNSGKITGEKTGWLVGEYSFWWACLPVWGQWLLRYLYFGWIWMP